MRKVCRFLKLAKVSFPGAITEKTQFVSFVISPCIFTFKNYYHENMKNSRSIRFFAPLPLPMKIFLIPLLTGIRYGFPILHTYRHIITSMKHAKMYGNNGVILSYCQLLSEGFNRVWQMVFNCPCAGWFLDMCKVMNSFLYGKSNIVN